MFHISSNELFVRFIVLRCVDFQQIQIHRIPMFLFIYMYFMSPFDLTPIFQGIPVVTESLELIGTNLSADFNLGASTAQTAVKKLGIHNKVKRYTRGQLLSLFKRKFYLIWSIAACRFSIRYISMSDCEFYQLIYDVR